MAAPVVEASGVEKAWGRTLALRNATFAVPRGITGLLGANGAGKTTLFGLMLGLHAVDAGSLRVLGLDPRRQGPAVRARTGYAPEHDALPPDVSAHDFVRHVAELHGLPPREATARASDTLFEVGLGEERFRAIGTMSTGQRQRVKLAQAVAHDPDLVLLDEPTNGLDPIQREQMLSLVRRIGHTLGIDVILSSHLLDEVERVSDAVVILDAGEAVASGPISEVRGGTQGVVVELAGTTAPEDAVRLAALLRDRGLDADVDGARVHVAANDDEALDAVRDAAADAAVALRRVEPRRSTLEDVFLAGTISGDRR